MPPLTPHPPSREPTPPQAAQNLTEGQAASTEWCVSRWSRLSAELTTWNAQPLKSCGLEALAFGLAGCWMMLSLLYFKLCPKGVSDSAETDELST